MSASWLRGSRLAPSFFFLFFLGGGGVGLVGWLELAMKCSTAGITCNATTFIYMIGLKKIELDVRHAFKYISSPYSA